MTESTDGGRASENIGVSDAELEAVVARLNSTATGEGRLTLIAAPEVELLRLRVDTLVGGVQVYRV